MIITVCSNIGFQKISRRWHPGSPLEGKGKGRGRPPSATTRTKSWLRLCSGWLCWPLNRQHYLKKSWWPSRVADWPRSRFPPSRQLAGLLTATYMTSGHVRTVCRSRRRRAATMAETITKTTPEIRDKPWNWFEGCSACPMKTAKIGSLASNHTSYGSSLR